MSIFFTFCVTIRLEISTSTGGEMSLTLALKKGVKGGPKKHQVTRIYYFILFQILNPTGVPHLCPLPNWKELGWPASLSAIKVENRVERERRWVPSVEPQPAFRCLGAPNDSNIHSTLSQGTNGLLKVELPFSLHINRELTFLIQCIYFVFNPPQNKGSQKSWIQI